MLDYLEILQGLNIFICNQSLNINVYTMILGMILGI